jgi:hypothetical protein
MTEQEYMDKLQVREQLSISDRLRVLEYEVQQLIEDKKTAHTIQSESDSK